jgi:hypothetical protein
MESDVRDKISHKEAINRVKTLCPLLLLEMCFDSYWGITPCGCS